MSTEERTAWDFYLSPLDNYIVAHLVDCVNTFFMFFYVFLSSEKAVLLYRVPLATLLTAFLYSPLDNYNYTHFWENVNTFFKSYFFNKIFRPDQMSVNTARPGHGRAAKRKAVAEVLRPRRRKDDFKFSIV